MREFVDWGYLEHKPPAPLSIFIRGLEPILGRSISNVSNSVRRLNRSPVEVEPLLGIFPPLDLGLVVQIVLSLFVLLFTYDAICGEKEAGTLRLTASFSVPRHHLLAGKLLGALVPILAAFGLPLLLGIAAVILMPEVQLSNPAWFRLGGILAGIGLYLTAFICVGLFASCLVRKAATSFVFLLSLWVAAVVVLPRLSLFLADAVRPAPSVHELETEKDTVSRANRDRWRESRWAWNRQNPDWSKTPEGQEARWLHWRRSRHEVSWLPNQSQYARLEEAFNNRYNARMDLAVVLARSSPAFAFNNATVRLAGTGLQRQQRFLDAFNRYRLRYRTWYIDTSDRDRLRRAHPAKYGEYQWDISDLPRFTYRETGSDGDLQIALIDIGILAVWSILFFAGACIAIHRYDLR